MRTEPPEDAAYQSITAPEEEAEMATVPVPHRELLLAVGAVGTAFIVNVLLDVALVHVPFPVAVSVNVTLPAVISAAFGVYVQVVSEVAFANVPPPLEVQVTPALFVELEPAVILTAPELEQVEIAVPATAVGTALIVTVTGVA